MTCFTGIRQRQRLPVQYSRLYLLQYVWKELAVNTSQAYLVHEPDSGPVVGYCRYARKWSELARVSTRLSSSRTGIITHWHSLVSLLLCTGKYYHMSLLRYFGCLWFSSSPHRPHTAHPLPRLDCGASDA